MRRARLALVRLHEPVLYRPRTVRQLRGTVKTQRHVIIRQGKALDAALADAARLRARLSQEHEAA